MSSPTRIQLSRRAGFNLQQFSRSLNGLPALNVGRPTEWGNQFAAQCWTDIKTGARCWWIESGPSAWRFKTKEEAQAGAVTLFRALVNSKAQAKWRARARLALKGHNLACWCKHGTPCHADVWFEVLADAVAA